MTAGGPDYTIFRLSNDEGSASVEETPFPLVAYIIWVLFIVVMAILFLNFLVSMTTKLKCTSSFFLCCFVLDWFSSRWCPTDTGTGRVWNSATKSKHSKLLARVCVCQPGSSFLQVELSWHRGKVFLVPELSALWADLCLTREETTLLR